VEFLITSGFVDGRRERERERGEKVLKKVKWFNKNALGCKALYI